MTCPCSQNKPEFRPGVDTEESIAKAGTGDVPPAPTGAVGVGTGVLIGLVLGTVVGGALGVMLAGGLAHESHRRKTLARRREAGYAY